jgi:predicted metal-dependent peptidase
MRISYQSPVVRGIQSFLQGHAGISISNIVFMADISGGITDEQTDQTGLEMNCVMQAFQVPSTLLDFDHRVREMRFFRRGEHIFPQESGNGGTDYRPPFEYIKGHMLTPSIIICLTDGQCNLFADPPTCPVFWCLLDNAPFDPPYGTVIRIYADDAPVSPPKMPS